MASVKKILGYSLAGTFGTAALGAATLFAIPDPMDDAREARAYGGSMSRKNESKSDYGGLVAMTAVGLALWGGSKLLEDKPARKTRKTPAPRKP